MKRKNMQGLAGRIQNMAEADGYALTRNGRSDTFTLRKSGRNVISGDLATIRNRLLRA